VVFVQGVQAGEGFVKGDVAGAGAGVFFRFVDVRFGFAPFEEELRDSIFGLIVPFRVAAVSSTPVAGSVRA